MLAWLGRGAGVDESVEFETHENEAIVVHIFTDSIGMQILTQVSTLAIDWLGSV
jgi:hypothetical protein